MKWVAAVISKTAEREVSARFDEMMIDPKDKDCDRRGREEAIVVICVVGYVNNLRMWL